jgi:hypothetical protein
MTTIGTVCGQWAHTAAFRLELATPWWGDYRVCFEKKLRPNYVADAWERTYYHEYLRYQAPVRRLNVESRKRPFLGRKSVALQWTAGVIVRNREARYVRGASFRFDVKNYFYARGEPLGPYLMFGVGYIFEETLGYREYFTGSVHAHAPTGRVAFGWHFLWGRRRTFAFDLFAGAEYRHWFWVPQYGRPPLRFAPFPPVAFGTQLGFGFARRSLYF